MSKKKKKKPRFVRINFIWGTVSDPNTHTRARAQTHILAVVKIQYYCTLCVKFAIHVSPVPALLRLAKYNINAPCAYSTQWDGRECSLKRYLSTRAPARTWYMYKYIFMYTRSERDPSTTFLNLVALSLAFESREYGQSYARTTAARLSYDVIMWCDAVRKKYIYCRPHPSVGYAHENSVGLLVVGLRVRRARDSVQLKTFVLFVRISRHRYSELTFGRKVPRLIHENPFEKPKWRARREEKRELGKPVRNTEHRKAFRNDTTGTGCDRVWRATETLFALFTMCWSGTLEKSGRLEDHVDGGWVEWLRVQRNRTIG